ncbi:unnamed protein product [Brassica napus]|uniref:(rape) hypothetical protein n=1 Tax=Brassica napus TaxID=3708 RepID=A0A816RVZ2_BRANA|nr:unnamed protein product [Brassica napus]
MKRHLDSPIGVDPNLLFWPSPRTFHLLYSFYCERRLISIYIPETFVLFLFFYVCRHIDSRCFPSSPSPSIIAAPLTVGSKYMAASISIIPIHTVLSLAAFVRNSANASGNCLTSFPCNLKVDGKSQYLCKPTVNVNSLVLLTYMKAGCHNYVEVRILSFWEARNVKHKGELMGLTCSSLTQRFLVSSWPEAPTSPPSYLKAALSASSKSNYCVLPIISCSGMVWLPTTLNHYSMEPLLAIVSERRNVAVPSTFYRRRNIPNICQDIELAELWTNP